MESTPRRPDAIGRAHEARLRALWRSAGWPSHDPLELDLVAAGLLERRVDAAGRETLRLSDAGVQRLAAARRRHGVAHGAHEALVARVAAVMRRDGRLTWRGLRLRAPLPAPDRPSPVLPKATHPPGDGLPGGQPGGLLDPAPDTPPPGTRWMIAMPDVFSIRPSTREDFVLPVAHEVKVSRADLLADLRRPDKGAAYAAIASEAWYVLAAGIGGADEVPATFGVLGATAVGFEVLRAAPRRAVRVSLATWIALAGADREAAGPDDEPQPGLPEATG
jgi:hypothetical protein